MTSSSRTQNGAALIVSLVLLVATTLVGVFVMSSSHLEWLMSNNSRFQTDAAMRAEAVIQQGESDIRNNIQNNIPTPGYPTSFGWGNQYYYNPINPLPAAVDLTKINAWNGSFSTASASTAIGAPPGTTNEYLIDYLGCTLASPDNGNGCGGFDNTSLYTFRVWAHITDSKGAARIAQSTYSLTWIHNSKTAAQCRLPTIFLRDALLSRKSCNDKHP